LRTERLLQAGMGGILGEGAAAGNGQRRRCGGWLRLLPDLLLCLDGRDGGEDGNGQSEKAQRHQGHPE
jgi:hypothetical protein